MIRTLDLFLASVGIIVSMPLLTIIFVVLLFENGSPVFKQKRLGRYKQEFVLLKFRTMPRSTGTMATHEVTGVRISSIGKFLRSTKVDELPQLLNVLKGEMSLVGPRPCLTSQADLICERDKRDVFDWLPGITGLAQVKNVDMSDPVKCAQLDAYMLEALDLRFYLKIIIKTAIGKGFGDKMGQ